MELLSPAGSMEKLVCAYAFGADAAYMGFDGFSLRARADNFPFESAGEVARAKAGRKLHCALNIHCRDDDLGRLEERVEALKAFPFDAFIVSDIGLVPLLRRHFPETALHLSTQANCLNSESAKFYRDMGFTRIVPGRELSLRDIGRMKAAVPDLEIEAFAHGAMCLAYSGRCFLSAWMAGRSANSGNCAHSCRWEWRLLEEAKRPGATYPVIEGAGFTEILSSKDICMVDRLAEMRDAGVDAIKIEGRMKSVYYLAVVTKAYRMALDRLAGKPVDEAELTVAKDDLFTVSHREYCTGFYFGPRDVETPARPDASREATFLGTVAATFAPDFALISPANHIDAGETIEAIGPNAPPKRLENCFITGEYGEPLAGADHGKYALLANASGIGKGWILRRK